MNKIKKLISQKDWKSLISDHSAEEVCSSLSFSEAMHVVKHLFYDDIQDDEKQQYALKLAFKIENHFKKDWESDWKNDVFLGNLCEMLWLYDKRYFYYKRAYTKLKDPPVELLLMLSNCNSTPDTSPITNKEAEFYLRKALEKKLTCEVAIKMRSLYRQKKDKYQEEYWDQIYKKLSKDNVHVDLIVPDIFRLN
jgi:hypothetical protein